MFLIWSAAKPVKREINQITEMSCLLVTCSIFNSWLWFSCASLLLWVINLICGLVAMPWFMKLKPHYFFVMTHQAFLGLLQYIFSLHHMSSMFFLKEKGYQAVHHACYIAMFFKLLGLLFIVFQDICRCETWILSMDIWWKGSLIKWEVNWGQLWNPDWLFAQLNRGSNEYAHCGVVSPH